MGKAAKHLNPQFTINTEQLVMSTAELAGIPVSSLGEKAGTLKERRERSSPPWISFCRVFEIADVEEKAIAPVAMRVRQAGIREMSLFPNSYQWSV